MILLEKPYISEFLLQTLEKGRIPVVQTPLAEEIAIGRNLNLLHESEVISKYNGSVTLFFTPIPKIQSAGSKITCSIHNYPEKSSYS